MTRFAQVRADFLVKNLRLRAPRTFHHQVVIHRWGWTLVLNPDGTTTAWNKDKTKVLHSHSHPPGPGNTPGRPGAQLHFRGRSDQPRFRLPMLRDPLRDSCPSSSTSRT
jgi:hypothetical protein